MSDLNTDFTPEEMSLLCIYETTNRKKLIEEIRQGIPFVYEPELLEIMNRVIVKLEKVSDKAFSEISFYSIFDFKEENEESEV